MTPHAEHVALRATALGPVHVGAGTDFDPTGYVIDAGVLYPFDPAAVPLDAADRRALLSAVNQRGEDAILAVQRFFHARVPLCIGAARQAIPVADGVARQYDQRVGRLAQHAAGGREKVVNQLVIERTTHHPHSGIAYLPGSSLKGAMRTAWLDRINGGRPRPHDERAPAMETRLLDGGAWHTDPLRLLGVGDAAGPAVASQVVFSVNHHKRLVERDGQELPRKGPPARRECMAAAQFGALACTVTVDRLGGHHTPRATPAIAGRIAGWADLASACNRYYRPRLAAELALLDERRFAVPEWLAGMRALLAALAPDMDTGQAVLLRVGRHSGAENVTLDGVRWIRIGKGPGRSDWSEIGATTVWLAGEHETARSGLQPFGWLLLHRDGHDLPALQAWCERQPRPATEAAHAALAAARRTARDRAAVIAADRAAQAAHAAAAEAAAAAHADRLRSLSEHGLAVERLRDRLASHTAARKQPVGGQFYQEWRTLLALADVGGWAAGDRLALAELARTLVPDKIDLGARAKEVRQAAARLAEGT